MAAIVIDCSVTTASWSKAKPKDYKNTDLDKSISAWEALAKKSVTAAVKPSTKSIKGYEAAIKDADGIVKHLKDCAAQLDKVMAAAKKAEGELKKLADKLKGTEKSKYQDAANVAAGIGSNAAGDKKSLA